MPKCALCGQAEHGPLDGVIEHCKTCRQSIYAGTRYWIWRGGAYQVDCFYCEECVTWNRSAEYLTARAWNLMRRGPRR